MKLDLKNLIQSLKEYTFEGNYNAKGSYLPDNGDGIVFVHRSNTNFQICTEVL
jgi:hypothetical protein